MNLRAVAEAYPQLQAASNFAQLQEELTSTENRIAFSRQNYNAVVQQLNTAVRTIPWMLFSGLAGVTTREFYEIPDEAQRQAPKVEF